MLKDLEKVKELGSGAFATVYLYLHRKTNKYFAVKKINYKNDEKLKNSIETEIKSLYGCSCQNIIRCLASFYDDGLINIVLDFMDKGTLSDVLKKAGSIPEKVLSAMSYQMIKGLMHLHQKRIVHRDIKPLNILANSKGLIKISDFGVSGEILDTIIGRDTPIGTYKYMSPERIFNKNYTFVSDVWSIGMSILECALGVYPYNYNNENKIADIWMFQKIVLEPPTIPEDNFSSEFVNFIKKCLNKDPEKRATVEELINHPFINHTDTTAVEEVKKFFAKN